MSDRDPMIQTIDAAARHQRSDLLDRVSVGGTRFIVEENGVRVAAAVSIEEFRRLTALEARRKADFAILEEMQAAFADVPNEEVEREIERALAEVRAAARAPVGREVASAR